MLKVTMVIGQPCAGKSLLIRQLMQLDNWESRVKKYLNHHYCPERRSVILGSYANPRQKYPGTDRLSMACQPHFLDWIHELSVDADGSNIGKPCIESIIFEGDRLGNQSCLRDLRFMHNFENINFEVIALTLSPELLAKRRESDRKDQNEKFWKSRLTKFNNLMQYDRVGGLKFKVVEHVNLSDTHNLIAHIRKNRI